MNNDDLRRQIIKSAAADRMLETITKGFYDRSYVGLWIMEILGREMDDIVIWVQDIFIQAFPQTATWGLDYWEIACQLPNSAGLPYPQRRAMILQKLGGGRLPISPYRIEWLVSSYINGPAYVTEHLPQGRFTVSFDSAQDGGIDPFMYELIYKAVRDIRPAQLLFSFAAKDELPTNNTYVASTIISERKRYRMNPVPDNFEMLPAVASMGIAVICSYKREFFNAIE